MNRFQKIALLSATLYCLPVLAQVDLSGEWGGLFHWDQRERIPGPELGDYLGLPINNAASMRGPKEEGGTLIVPGHGRLCDEADVVEYRDMVTIIKDRIEEMMAKGMTLDQIKSARPTADYDPRYGGNPAWTADNFVEAAYADLKSKSVR